MEKIYFNIRPQLDLFIAFYKAYFIIINLFLLISFILLVVIIYKIVSIRNKINKTQKEYNDLISQIKNYHKKRLLNLEGKEFIKEFIRYLETLSINSKYQNIEQILKFIGVENEDIISIKKIIYQNDNSYEVVEKLKNTFK